MTPTPEQLKVWQSDFKQLIEQKYKTTFPDSEMPKWCTEEFYYRAGRQASIAEIDELKDRLKHEVDMIDGAASDEINKLKAELKLERDCVDSIILLNDNMDCSIEQCYENLPVEDCIIKRARERQAKRSEL